MTEFSALSALGGIEKAVGEFRTALPGWWFTVGVCSVSRDASCGPDLAGPDAYLLELKDFDGGFHYDDHSKGSTCADCLRAVTKLAQHAKDNLYTMADSCDAGVL